MKLIEKYKTSDGKEPFTDWYSHLDGRAQTKVDAYIVRASTGHVKNLKRLDKGLFEMRIDFGPGYRIYYGDVAGKMILLLFGGHKGSQDRDIERARKYWRHYNETHKKL